MIADKSKKWYIVRSIGGKEKKVKDHIESEVDKRKEELSDYLGKILIPSEKVVQIRKGKKITLDKVCMPGYIMIEANLNDKVLHMIKSITGIIGFLGETKGGKPVPMSETEINKMLGRFDRMSLEPENVVIPYEVGDVVKIVDGAFKGFHGTIEELNKEKRRLKVIVKIFGRSTPLELSYTQVNKMT